MNKLAAYSYAVGAIFTAALTPVGLLTLRAFGAPDLAQGFIIGVGIATTMLLCAFALRQRTA